jgi:signal transduction histidine kinase
MTEAQLRHSRTAAAPRFPWSAESLRWVMGLYCAFIGAFVLVAPHHFASPPYLGLLSFRTAWGCAALGSGVALLAAAVLQPRKLWSLLIHGAAGATLVLLGWSFARSSLWSGVVTYTVLGLGTAAAGSMPYLRPTASRPAADLFALLVATYSIVTGGLMLGASTLYQGAYFDALRPYLPALGSALALSGLLLAWVNLRAAPRTLTLLAYLATGGTLIAMGILGAFPRRAWTGIALNLGGGAVLAVLPWLSARLASVDTSALRSRLALALATATSVALVLSVAVATSQEERLAIEQVREARQIEANAIAQNVSDYVQLNAARTATVAATAGRVPMRGREQRLLLAATRKVYPDVTAFFCLSPAGGLIAAAGEAAVSNDLLLGLAQETRREPAQRVGIRLVPAGERPLLLFSLPIVGERNELAGVLVTAFDSEALARRIARRGSSVHLADGYGQVIARREASFGPSPQALEPPRLPPGWDVQVKASRVPATERRIAAFAVVPDVGWVVAVEKPRAAALAGVRHGRDMAFALLLAVVPVAVGLGIVAARRIARPLGTLADAVEELAAGNPGAPLDASGITEVARLSASFRAMRDRLAERTRESERLAAELRARAEALADSDRRKDEFLAMLAHELRNPLGAIANAAYVLGQMGSAEPPAERSIAVIQRQIQHLVRLVDDLLDVSRITRGKVELRRGPADLKDAVRHAVETTRPVIEARQHHLRLTLPAEPLPLHADVTRLEQVVGNLLRNAARYTEPGGRIEVEARRESHEAVLAVRDNGAGIAPDLLPRVFDLFIQGEQSLDRSGAGLGIGLTLVRSLVEMHGGRVEAKSDGPGRGSEFIVRLPLAA